MTRLVSLPEAAAAVPPGATLTCGGFQLNRAPMALVRELIRQKKRRLRLFLLPNPLPLDYLVGAGCVSFADIAFAGMEIGHKAIVPPNWQKSVEAGSVRCRERDALYLIQALRAAAMGLPFLPLPVNDGLRRDSDLGRVRSPFTGKRVPVVQAFRPRVGLVHAQAADHRGNLWMEDPVTDGLVSRASQSVIATAEEIVPRLSQVTIPSLCVHSVAHAPRGAWPTACPHRYPQDDDHLQEYVTASRQGKFLPYLREILKREEHPVECAS